MWEEVYNKIASNLKCAPSSQLPSPSVTAHRGGTAGDRVLTQFCLACYLPSTLRFGPYFTTISTTELHNISQLWELFVHPFNLLQVCILTDLTAFTPARGVLPWFSLYYSWIWRPSPQFFSFCSLNAQSLTSCSTVPLFSIERFLSWLILRCVSESKVANGFRN